MEPDFFQTWVPRPSNKDRRCQIVLATRGFMIGGISETKRCLTMLFVVEPLSSVFISIGKENSVSQSIDLWLQLQHCSVCLLLSRFVVLRHGHSSLGSRPYDMWCVLSFTKLKQHQRFIVPFTNWPSFTNVFSKVLQYNRKANIPYWNSLFFQIQSLYISIIISLYSNKTYWNFKTYSVSLIIIIGSCKVNPFYEPKFM